MSWRDVEIEMVKHLVFAALIVETEIFYVYHIVILVVGVVTI